MMRLVGSFGVDEPVVGNGLATVVNVGDGVIDGSTVNVGVGDGRTSVSVRVGEIVGVGDDVNVGVTVTAVTIAVGVRVTGVTGAGGTTWGEQKFNSGQLITVTTSKRTTRRRLFIEH